MASAQLVIDVGSVPSAAVTTSRLPAAKARGAWDMGSDSQALSGQRGLAVGTNDYLPALIFLRGPHPLPMHQRPSAVGRPRHAVSANHNRGRKYYQSDNTISAFSQVIGVDTSKKTGFLKCAATNL